MNKKALFIGYIVAALVCIVLAFIIGGTPRIVFGIIAAACVTAGLIQDAIERRKE